mgnify:CR=1 FL=1
MVPVQATVIILNSSGFSPQLTMTAGNGYIIVPGLKSVLAILFQNIVNHKNIIDA